MADNLIDYEAVSLHQLYAVIPVYGTNHRVAIYTDGVIDLLDHPMAGAEENLARATDGEDSLCECFRLRKWWRTASAKDAYAPRRTKPGRFRTGLIDSYATCHERDAAHACRAVVIEGKRAERKAHAIHCTRHQNYVPTCPGCTGDPLREALKERGLRRFAANWDDWASQLGRTARASGMLDGADGVKVKFRVGLFEPVANIAEPEYAYDRSSKTTYTNKWGDVMHSAADRRRADTIKKVQVTVTHAITLNGFRYSANVDRPGYWRHPDTGEPVIDRRPLRRDVWGVPTGGHVWVLRRARGYKLKIVRLDDPFPAFEERCAHGLRWLGDWLARVSHSVARGTVNLFASMRRLPVAGATPDQCAQAIAGAVASMGRLPMPEHALPQGPDVGTSALWVAVFQTDPDVWQTVGSWTGADARVQARAFAQAHPGTRACALVGDGRAPRMHERLTLLGRAFAERPQ